MEISHCDFSLTSLMSSARQWNTLIAAVSKTMFFQNVAQLLITMASPKHPQSDTGLAMAR